MASFAPGARPASPQERARHRFAAALTIAVALGLAAATAGAAAAAVPKRPLILSIAATAPGGTHPVAIGKRVTMTVRVRNATSCTFLAQHTPASKLYLVRTVACRSGYARVAMPAVKNPASLEETLSYKVRVRGRGGVVEEGLSVVAASRSTEGPSPVPPPAATPATAPPPSAPFPVPAPESLGLAYSPNWSGYAVEGGPFTGVSGTFNVPDLNAASTKGDVGEWVGIDGASNNSLIQAGVGQSYDPATNSVLTYAWWEILPALSTPIAMTVSPGDEMNVTIGQLSGTLWAISITDETTGERFLIDQDYTGPGTSAEWIVEAPTSGSTGALDTLGNYVPGVTFTGLGVNGAASSTTEVILNDGSSDLSVPSPLTANGFTVAYGGTTPAAP
jgi:hypothetical protein